MNHRSAFVWILAVSMFGAGAFPRSAAPVPILDAQDQAKELNVATSVREAAWAPDGKRVAATWFETIWTMSPEGRDAKRLVVKPEDWIVERDPAWSPDGKSIAFSADTNGQFDLWVAPAAGGTARRVTSMPGDERWPSWTRDGRLLFSHRAPKGRWQLFLSTPDPSATPTRFSPETGAEWQGRVSPDGKLVAFVSDREPDANNDADIWVRELRRERPLAAAHARDRRRELSCLGAGQRARRLRGGAECDAEPRVGHDRAVVRRCRDPDGPGRSGRAGTWRQSRRRTCRRRAAGCSIGRGSGHARARLASRRRSGVVAGRTDAR